MYKCVHLELVTFISTECFIQAFRHFIARRGRPSIVYSDNGTNFVGASAGLKKVDWEKVVSQETLNPITWKFIPPMAAWWGGWWERLICSVKNLFVRVLGTTDLDILDRNKLLIHQHFCQELREQTWSCFRKEYLGQLIQRHGHKDCELKVGDIILARCENLKRVNWPIARVQEFSTGRDRCARVVKVKIRNGILTRPVRKLSSGGVILH
ncbi:integrase catalytic domain-containing protein [Trichonephila clavipes]|nr:integrase catalytic domain-containing protein [Trichonephila clavipes]